MTADIENLVLEQLRHIRAKVDKNELAMDEVKSRLTRVELAVVSIKRDFADSLEDQIRNHVASDRICTLWSASKNGWTCRIRKMKNKYEHDLNDYFKAMRTGDSETCYAIEQRHCLDGYPPEIVTAALSGAAKGKDMQEAIDEYLQD